VEEILLHAVSTRECPEPKLYPEHQTTTIIIFTFPCLWGENRVLGEKI